MTELELKQPIKESDMAESGHEEVLRCHGRARHCRKSILRCNSASSWRDPVTSVL
jgi:hypothetical protein